MEPETLAETRIGTAINRYRNSLWKLGLEDKRSFVDITYREDGRICTVYYNETTSQYEFKPL